MKSLLIIFIGMLLVGCDIFKTRTPEEPIQSKNIWIPATTVDILLENLKNSLSDKSTENYLRCLIDPGLTGRNFNFIPATESYTSYPEIFNNWSLQNERAYFENLKSKIQHADGVILSIFNEDRGSIQGDSILFSGDYLLIVNHSIDNFPKEFQGHLQFTLFRNLKGEWAIMSWKDSKKSNYSTWSDLKGRFSY